MSEEMKDTNQLQAEAALQGRAGSGSDRGSGKDLLHSRSEAYQFFPNDRSF